MTRAGTLLLRALPWTLVCLATALAAAEAQPNTPSEPDSSAAVVVADEREFHAMSGGRARYRVRRVLEIRGPSGRKHGKTAVPETRLVKTKRLEGRLLDAGGNEIRKLRDDDVLRVQMAPSDLLYSDAKYRVFDLQHDRYPYTLEYSYEQDFETLFVWPDWEPGDEIPVRRAVYRLVVDDGVGFRTHGRNAPAPQVSRDKSRTTHTWTVGPLAAESTEDLVPPEERAQVSLWFAPRDFRVENTRGTLDSWDGLAAWYRSLARDRYELDARTRDEVRGVAGNAASAEEKIRLLHAHLQRRFRYVAIEIGIGGWQPSRAQETYDRRYGDCKDLSTVMIAMLGAVGVPAYPALTLTRNNGIVVPEFPSNRFDHCIAFVPLEGDSLFLECTSPFTPAGDLPSAVEGADVLLVLDGSGRLARTPTSAAEENRLETRLRGELRSDGTLAFSFDCAVRGNRAAQWRESLRGLRADEIRTWARAVLGRLAPDAELQKVEVENLAGRLEAPVRLRVSGLAPGFAARATSRIVLTPDVRGRPTSVPSRDATAPARGYYLPFASVERDSVEVALPAGFRLEGGPGPENRQGEAGGLRIDYAVGADGVFRWTRELRFDRRVVPAEGSAEVEALLQAAARSAGARFSFARGS